MALIVLCVCVCVCVCVGVCVCAGEGTELYRQNGTLDTPLTPFQEITSHNLMYDLVDAELFGRRWIGCPTPERLTKHKAWAGCLALPEDLSPRSLRCVCVCVCVCMCVCVYVRVCLCLCVEPVS